MKVGSESGEYWWNDKGKMGEHQEEPQKSRPCPQVPPAGTRI